jgi:monoamine oxidase
MSGSIFRTLHQRYGTPVAGAESRRRASEHQQRVGAALAPGGIPQPAASQSVAIVGAGFAGCAAAWALRNAGFGVTVFDAQGRAGGRVESSPSIVTGRIIEKGAEMIGRNHPYWVRFANMAGLGLMIFTPEDEEGGGMLDGPLILKGHNYDEKEQKALYEGMKEVFDGWVKQAKAIVDPWQPWTTPNAATLDAQSLAQNIPAKARPDVKYAIETEFENNNTLKVSNQSWLAILAQIAAGGGDGFFEETEMFRCSAGNQRLASWLLGPLVVQPGKVKSIEVSNTVTLGFEGDKTAGPFDYVIVAVPVATWSTISVDKAGFPFKAIASGPATKYLAPIATRFWITQGLSPRGSSDVLGMTWDGTDNQADTAGFDLTVFAGGSAASSAIAKKGTDAYFKPLISALYPGFETPGGTFVNWPANPAIGTGYSCPAPTQVTQIQKTYSTPYKGRLIVAGEHTSPAWFGFMEGALESGIKATALVAEAAAELER